MRNVHQRQIRAGSEELCKWIDRLWSGTEDDCFPRDHIPTWRTTDGVRDPTRLVAGRTKLGHGPFTFNFEGWNGRQWRVTVNRGGMAGWHGFDLIPERDGIRLTHTIELDLRGTGRVYWHCLIAPVHDWAVEAIFDRLEEALKTGTAPRHTKRAMPFVPRIAFTALRLARLARRATGGGRRRSAGASEARADGEGVQR
jgi:hypothetical protein